MGWARWRGVGWDPRRKAASGMLGMGAVGWPGVGWDRKGVHTHLALVSYYRQRWCLSSLQQVMLAH